MHHVCPRIHTIQSAKLLFFFGTHKYFYKNFAFAPKNSHFCYNSRYYSQHFPSTNIKGKCVYVSSTNGACLPHLWVCFMVVFYFLGKLKW